MAELRIAFVITELGLGGAEHMLCKLAEIAQSTSIKLMVVSLIDEGVFGDRIRATGAEVVSCHLNSPRGLLGLLRAYRKVRLFQPTLLQGWMYHGNLLASIFGRLLPKRPAVLWSMRQTLYSLSDEPLRLRWVIRVLAAISNSVKAVIYNSSLSLTQHQAAGLVSKYDLMIPNGFDLSRYKPNEEYRHALRARWGIEKDAPVVGLVARRHPMKDHPNFIAAAELLSKRLPAVRFVLVGLGTDTEEMRAALREAGIADRTFCMGRVPQSEQFYPAFDVSVLSSAWGEGWPNVLGEAMACGVVCVATDIGESSQIVGDTGVIVPARNPQAMAKACQDLLEQDRDMLRLLGARARERVMTNFDINAVFQRHLDVWAMESVNSPGEG